MTAAPLKANAEVSGRIARDIFEIVFQNAETIWRDCDWPRFVGFTSKHPDIYGFKVLAAKGPCDWRQAVGDYLDALPEQIEYLLRIDEDALFMSPVDGTKLDTIADLIIREHLILRQPASGSKKPSRPRSRIF
jgi:hypothetical protein